MARRKRLTGGSHTRPNGETIHVGETFEPTEAELEGPLRGRVAPAGSGFVTVPGEAWDRIFGGDDEEA